MPKQPHFLRLASALGCALILSAGCGGGGDPLQRGMDALRRGEFENAVAEFQRAEGRLPLSATVQANLALARYELGQNPIAIAGLRRAAELDRTQAGALEWLGRIHLRLQNLEEARRVLEEAQQRQPDSARILTARAVVEMRSNQPKRALDLLTLALSLDPAYAPALYNLGVLHRALPDGMPASTAYFERYLRAAPPAEPHAELARRHLAASATPGGGLSRPAGSSPAQPLLDAARAALAAQDTTRALLSLKEAVRTDPSFADAIWELARLYDQVTEDAPRASELYVRFRDSFPADSRYAAAQERIAALMGARQWPLASRMAGRETPDPRRAERSFAHGVELQRAGDSQQAIGEYLQTLRYDRGHRLAALNLGLLHHALGDLNGARDALEYTLQLRPGYSEAAYPLAEVYRDLGLLDRAIREAEAVLARDPNHARCRYLLGSLLWASNRPVEAREHFEAYLRLAAPGDPLVREVRAWLGRR
jgi:tetratricopeptide (TPR) repeat protein